MGITGNYLKVLLDGDDDLMNRFAEVRLEEPGEDGRWAVTLQSVEPAPAGRPTGAARAAATGEPA